MGLSNTLRSSLVAGIALVAPLVVTVVALQLVFGWLEGALDPIVDGIGLRGAGPEIVAELIALGILLSLVAALGYVAQRRLGAYVFGALDRVLGAVPVVSVVYNGVRGVSNALTRGENRFESVVRVEYPREGIYSFGFVTAETPETVAEGTYNVYIPNSPNPTQGRLVFVPADRLEPVDMRVSQALRLLVTTGLTDDREEARRLSADGSAGTDSGGVDL